MKLIDKYLLRQYAAPLFYCMLTFSMVFVIVDLFEHLSDFIDAKTPLWEVGLYYAMLLPSLMVYIGPISLLLALLYSLWQMSKHNELTAMRASGVSLYRLTIPFWVVGLLFSLGVSAIQETVAPWTSYWGAQFVTRQKHGNNDPSARYALDLPFKNERDHRIWVIRKFDLTTHDMQGLKVVQQRNDGSDLETIRADEGKYYDGRWWFFNVTIQKHDYYNNPVGPVEYMPVREMTDWSEGPKDFLCEVKDPVFLSSLELWKFLKAHRNLSEKTYARITVDLHARLAMPWTCLVVTLFGIPCGIRTARKGAFVGVIFALLAFFGFYILMTVFQWAGKNQMLAPWLSAWLPNMIFLGLGIMLMVRHR